MSSRRIRARRTRRNGGVAIAGTATFLVAFVVVVVLALTGGAAAYAVVMNWLVDLPDYESPTAFKVAQATKIYSADGKLLARLYLENRTVVPMSEIATDLAHALVSVEDERFYQHDGVDYQGIARAAVTNVMAGSTQEGASTITQQYVDNTLLRDERLDRTLRYKVREAFLAMELEKRRTKDEILGLYLNTVYFGDGAYGAQAAAQTYFSKDAKGLTLAEAALMAGLPQAPSRLDPYTNPKGALARRNDVLARMLRNGYVDRERYDAAVAEKLVLKRAVEPLHGVYGAPYFVAHVKKLLQAEYDQSLVFQGGLSVYTTIDMRMQEAAETAVFTSLDRPGDPDCALVSIDPRNGYVKALVGGKDFAQNKFNLATQGKRQPGSSFKTFVLVAALEEGMPPYRYVDSSSPAAIPATPAWVVSNSEGRGRGLITIDAATRASVNTVFARLVWDLNDKTKTGTKSGAQKVAELAKRMGIETNIPAFPSIALGSQNVSPLEMASAYGTLATNGMHYPATAITKIVGPDGAVVFESELAGQQVVTPEVAYAATTVLKGVVSGGTAGRARIGRPVAGKTGTSQNYRDAWFVGYTPQLVTSVWVGYYKSETPMLNVHGSRGFGGTLSAPIWAKFMKVALEGQPVLDFPKQAKPKYKWKPEWDSRISVARVVGLSRGACEETLKESGLKIVYVEQYDPVVPRGFVISQNPPGASRVKQNVTVTITISKGPAPSAPTTATPGPSGGATGTP